MTRRYPLDALVAASGLTEDALGRKVGLTGTPLKRARRHGLLETAAERYAVRAGFHPHCVWPEMADHAIADHSKPCAECGEPFVPRRSDQLYCARECRWRHASREGYRRRYRTDPAFAEAQRRRVADYQADPRVAEVRRRKERARYAARRGRAA